MILLRRDIEQTNAYQYSKLWTSIFRLVVRIKITVTIRPFYSKRLAL